MRCGTEREWRVVLRRAGKQGSGSEMAGSGYDYIIVGAGSAGCVLANRLSADGAARVLLIEAGGRDWHPYIHIPLGMGRMHDYGMFDWGYQTDPEPNLNGRRIEAMRGKVLGGSSSINVMAYTRGNPGDYDRWAQKGARGWSYADVLPYFRRCETWEGGADTWRGGRGSLGTEFARTKDPLYDACSRPPRPAAIRSRRITTANSRKGSAAANTPFATAGARPPRTPSSSRRADARTSPSPPTHTPRACCLRARAPTASNTSKTDRPCAPRGARSHLLPPAPSIRRSF